MPSICFFPTLDCNLGCTYCYHGKPSGQVLSVESAQNFLLTHCNPFEERTGKVSLSFFGGEPSLHMDVIEAVHTMCKAAYGTRSWAMTTNGSTLLLPYRDTTVGQWMVANQGFFTLSLDGPREAHDEHRRTKDGRGTFDTIMAGIESIRGSRPVARCTLRCTIWPGSGHSFLDRLRFLDGLCLSGIGGHVTMGFSIESTENPGCKARDCAVDFDDVEAQFGEAADWFVSECGRGYVPHWADMCKGTLIRLIQGERRRFTCGAGSNYLVCLPDGSLGMCHRIAAMPQPSQRDWHDCRKADGRIGCLDCEILDQCGGGCRANSMLAGLPCHEPSPADCRMKMIRVRTAKRILAAIPGSAVDEIKRRYGKRPAPPLTKRRLKTNHA